MEDIVRCWLSVFVLGCFLSQQFLCCGADCSMCAESEHHAGATSCCGHHHESPTDDHDEPASLPEHSPHHLCVATHVFYVLRDHQDETPPNVANWVALAPATDFLHPQPACCSGQNLAEGDHSPPDPRQVRALLSVWVI
ncbi:MAG: hypothetical protein B7Z55_07280 [Planctomycetales bacterium 12-60-4]|nr:MAG: hypothetical protein B7Z55_07280 [Planctomycetales bacterium 12-60-4]